MNMKRLLKIFNFFYRHTLRIGVEILFWENAQKRLQQNPDQALGLGSAQKNYFRNGMLKGYFGACPLFALMAFTMLKGYFGACPLFALMAFTMWKTNAMMAMAMIPRMPNPSNKTKGIQRIR